MTLTEALATVQYGDITGDAGAAAILCGIPAGQVVLPLRPADSVDSAAWYIWSGSISGAVGHYWIPQPLSGVAVEAAVDKHGWDTVCGWGKGIGTATVADTVCALAECDHLTLTDQAALWDRVAADTGCPLSAAVMSGDPRPLGAQAGKSVHVYWALQPHDRDTWDAIQAHLIAIGRSDPAIINVDRKMRRPGAHSGGRWQTVLLATPVVTDPQVFLAGLKRMAAAEGIGDVAAAVRALRFGFGLHRRAIAAVGSVQDELRTIADRTLTARSVDPADETRATALVGRRVGGATGTVATGATRDRRTLAPSTLVSGIWGTVRLDGVTGHRHCFCPDHGGTGGGAAFTDLGTGGMPYIHCATCGVTWHCDDPNADRWVLGQVVTGADAESAADVVDAVTAAVPVPVPVPSASTMRTEAVDQRYLDPIIPGSEITYVKSPQNTGKTFGLRFAAGTCKRTLVIGHRVSLLTKLAADLGLTHYQQCPDGDISEPRLAVTVNSLHRVLPPGKTAAEAWDRAEIDGTNPEGSRRPWEGYDLVIIDESEQVVRHLYGGTIQGKAQARAYRAVETAIRGARYVICLDADLSALTVRAVRRWKGWDIVAGNPQEEWVIENRYRARDRDIVCYQEKTDLIARMQEDWLDGKKLWVTSDSRRTAETIAHLLRTWNPQRGTAGTILTITADTREDAEPVALFTTPDAEIVKWDAVVVSPAVSTGLSVDAAHIDTVYLLLGGGSVTAADGLQMAYRIRNPKETTIRAWVSRRVEHRCTDPEQVKADKIWLNSDGVKLALKWQVVDGVPQLDPEDAQVWESWADVEAYERLGKNNLRSALQRVCDDRGVGLTWAPDLDDITRQAMSRVTRAAREKVTDELAHAIATAKVLTDAEYEQLSEKRHGLGRAEQYALRRYELADWYHGWGQAVVDADLVKADDGGRYRAALRRYVTLELVREGGEARDRAAGADVAAMRYGLRSRYTHYSQTAVVLDALLRLHGVPKGQDMETVAGSAVLLHPPTAAAWAKIDGMAPAIRELTGVSVPDSTARAKEPMRMLSYMLRTLGLSLDSVKVGPKGAQVREYRLDPVTAAETHGLSRARRAKLMGGGVVIPPTPETEAQWAALEAAVQELLG